MLSKKMLEAINYQINREIFSGYLYFSMATWCDEQNLPGFSTWMKLQGQEEITHATKFYQYVADQRGRVTLDAIEKPKTSWDSPLKMFEHVLEHEKIVTGLINKLMDTAVKENDRATKSFLKWFIDEQVQEESTADRIIGQIKMLGDDKVGLIMMDRELAKRIAEPTAEAAPAQ